MTPHLVLPLENIWLLSNRMHQNIGIIDKYYQSTQVWGRHFGCLLHSCKSLIRGPELYWENATSSFSRWLCETFLNSCLWLHWLLCFYQKMIVELRARLRAFLPRPGRSWDSLEMCLIIDAKSAGDLLKTN